jgi:hypothetical protein
MHYDRATGRAICEVCRGTWRIRPDDPLPIRHHCHAVGAPKGTSSERGLGDYIAALLVRVGIRKRPGCGCDARRQWLNRVGRWLARCWR